MSTTPPDINAEEFVRMLERHGFRSIDGPHTLGIITHRDTPDKEFLMRRHGETRREALNRLIATITEGNTR